MARGEMFILSAPSGTGKNTLIRQVLSRIERLEHSISHTTRSPRRGERDGVSYHFVDRSRFEAMIGRDEFLEWAEYNHELYGTSVVEIESRLARGIDVLMDIEIHGTERLLERCPDAHAIFVLPPDYETLQRRLTARGLDRAGAMADRLALSLWEIERYGLYQYVIINDDLDRASEALAAIILEKRQRLRRQEQRVAEILEDFRNRSTSSA